MIKNIIFDIGNVLCDFRWKEFLQDKGFEEVMIDRIAKASVLTPLWFELDRGEWSFEQIMDGFSKQDPEITDQLRKAFDDFTNMVTLREYAIPWIQELKSRGFRVYYLSNYSAKAAVDCADSLAFIPYTDGGILSYKEKVVKPGAAIYQLLLERYGLTAEESVFLDDSLPNVEGAKAVGIHGIWFQTKEQAQKELYSLIS